MPTKHDERAEGIDYFKYFHKKEPHSIMTMPISSRNSVKWNLNLQNIPSDTILNYNMNYCKLPDKKLFCFRNTYRKGSSSYTCFIIDEFNNVEAIQQGSPSHFAGSIYYNGCIYVAGCFSCDGKNNKFEKYDIKRKMWFQLPFINGIANKYSCDALKNKIIYSGDAINIYVYDIFLNSHCIALIFDEINWKFGNKYIFCVKNRAYAVIYNGGVYESFNDDPLRWSIFMKKSWLCDKELMSYPVACGYYFALMFNDTTIYKLNLKTQKVAITNVKKIAFVDHLAQSNQN